MPKPGIYESIITEALDQELERSDSDRFSVSRKKLHYTQASDRLALHLGQVLMRAIATVRDEEKVEVGVSLVREIIERIDARIETAGIAGDQILTTKEVLASILPFKPDGTVADNIEPLTPLLDTTLLTNARGEPRVGAQIEHEIESADRIDVLMAFIRVSGIRPFMKNLKRHCEKKSEFPRLRILTTTYTRSTELEALRMLKNIGAEIKVSYDTSTARLHAKAWHFHRESGASTAYIGSSNITYSAQESGIEWNVRVSGLRNPDVIRKMDSIFDAYWSGGDFRDFNAEEFERETVAETNEHSSFILSPVELRLEPFQERLLEQIQVARNKGRHRNLLVSATGTGKTVMAAVDYSSLHNSLPRSRLLFVAHREEILRQSINTFRFALRDSTFGEMWVGRHRPREFEYVFASIQSLNAASLENLDSDHFDIVIIDEFHHAAAPTYQRLISHLRPKELLGLTATPERTDGLSILDWFDGRIAAELRLWDAIDQHRLVPFIYYGIHDGLDLREIPWRRGTGYDINELNNVYTSNDAWARRVIKELAARVNDIRSMKALGFCVSIQHARFMERHFNEAGIPSCAIWGDTSDVERKQALANLESGAIQVLFSVDLLNEGIDVPSVDTLLLLRPTESATLFLQQLGRGLRKLKGKSACAVLDFVGMHRKEFRFDLKFSALLGGTRKYLKEQVENSFPYLPAGCHMELDTVASDIILDSLKNALPCRWAEKVAELKALVASGGQPSLSNYLTQTGLEIQDIYTPGKAWSDYLEAAGVGIQETGAHEVKLRRSIGRLLHIDDEERLNFYIKILDLRNKPDLPKFNERERRLTRMLVAATCEQVLEKEDTLEAGLNTLWAHSQVIAELHELFTLLSEEIDHVHSDLVSHQDSPLQVHGRYTRIEILAALGVGDTARTRPWREGALWVEGERADALAFTLNKSQGHFSPTTMYRDYAISRELIHWESQSNTRVSSPTGQRYCNHKAMGSEILLFARETTDDRAFWFLGAATYVSHESERPMGIKWKLDNSLPGDLYSRFAAAVA